MSDEKEEMTKYGALPEERSKTAQGNPGTWVPPEKRPTEPIEKGKEKP